MSDESNVEETPSDLDKATVILESLIEKGSSEDEMVVTLIQKGFKFAKAGRIMNQVLQSLGLKMSSKDRNAAVSEILTNWEFAPQSWQDVDACAESLAEEVDSTTPAQALTAIRKFAKENELDLPSKPKGGPGSRSSKEGKFYAWACIHKDATASDIEAFVASLGVSEKQAPKYVVQFSSRLEFARNFANA